MPPKPTQAQTQPTSSAKGGFDASKYVNKNRSVDQVNQLKEIFDIFDSDGSGLISIPEILDTISALNLQNESRNIVNIIQSSTTADELDFKTFVQIFGQPENQSEATLQQLYEVFDATGSGCFNQQDFEKVCQSVGERFTPQQIDQMIDYADKDRDGGINYEEFVATVTRQYPKV